MPSDYDSGTVTNRERLAADRQKKIARYNAQSVANQLDQSFATYDFADAQNKRLRDIQLLQNRRKAEADRFEAQRQLQNAMTGLVASAGSALAGSTLGNLMKIMEDRNDAENNTYWNQLQTNNDTVNNAYNESRNQNQAAKKDVVTQAIKSLRDIQSDLSANSNNINPNLYVEPGADKEIQKIQKRVAGKNVPKNMAQLSGYIMPDNAEQTVRPQRNIVQQGALTPDYFSTLINGFNSTRRY